jgi:hypothetical protein
MIFFSHHIVRIFLEKDESIDLNGFASTPWIPVMLFITNPLYLSAKHSRPDESQNETSIYNDDFEELFLHFFKIVISSDDKTFLNIF